MLVKREDLNHPYASGNKWWKLKYNLKEALSKGHRTLLTFGGAYSNHLYATAAAAHEHGLNSIGIVRGEEMRPLSPTLLFAKERGMHLHFVDRQTYRDKAEAVFVRSMVEKFGPFYLMPEGGTNALAIRGCEEWALELNKQISFDYLCLPVGTGGTMAGMINSLKEKTVIGFSSLKGGEFLVKEIDNKLKHHSKNWWVETEYHFGGYAKVNETLINFIKEFESNYHFQLDPVYTAKMMFGIYDLVKKGAFKPKSTILSLHTGGLQGRAGFNF